MKWFLRITAIAFLSQFPMVSSINFTFPQERQISKSTPEELASLLKPYFQIKKPEGKGPFPTVLGFHAAGGIKSGNGDWMNYLVGLGYATILVDSFTSRGLTQEQILQGKIASPAKRAGDAIVALDEARKLPFVDAERLALMAWSHGALTIMDLLAMDPPRELPPNLTSCSEQPFRGVRAAVLIYPPCGFPARSRGRGWSQDIRTLMLLSGIDSRAPAKDCLDIVSILRANGRPVTTHIYPSADHAFDMRAEDFKEYNVAPKTNPEAIADARLRVKEFLADAFNAK